MPAGDIFLTCLSTSKVVSALREAKSQEVERIKAIVTYQYGPQAAKIFENARVKVEVSKSTGRIRKIFIDGELFGSIRASDGFILPSISGALKLIKALPPLSYQVVIEEDAAVFVAKGRSVFCKHVKGCDDRIKAGDEVIIVTERGELVAVGRAVVSCREMKQKSIGVCVKIRKGKKS